MSWAEWHHMTWHTLSARPYALEGGKTSKDKRAEKEVRRRASRSALIKVGRCRLTLSNLH